MTFISLLDQKSGPKLLYDVFVPTPKHWSKILIGLDWSEPRFHHAHSIARTKAKQICTQATGLVSRTKNPATTHMSGLPICLSYCCQLQSVHINPTKTTLDVHFYSIVCTNSGNSPPEKAYQHDLYVYTTSPIMFENKSYF